MANATTSDSGTSDDWMAAATASQLVWSLAVVRDLDEKGLVLLAENAMLCLAAPPPAPARRQRSRGVLYSLASTSTCP